MLYDFMPAFDGQLQPYGQQTFSQFGEDVALWSWLETFNLFDENGYYVDVGAYHPVRCSNTYLLRRLLKWKGINIEPDPNLFKQFLIDCPECINLQVAVGKSCGSSNLTIYDCPGVNTLSEDIRKSQSLNPGLKVVDTVEVQVVTLQSILDKNYFPDREFRLLTVDAEGLDFDVISTVDFKVYRPRFVLIEDFECNLANMEESRIFRFLRDSKYIPVCHTMVTTLYRAIVDFI